MINKRRDAERVQSLARMLDLAKNEHCYARITSLLPHLIEEHYFFEGKETPYRAYPVFLIKALGK